MRATILAIFGIMLLGNACAEYDLAQGTQEDADSGAIDESDAADVAVRLDIYPPASLGDDGPPEQSSAFEAVEGELIIELADGIEVGGVLTGFDASPYTAVAVPGETAPVLGYVQATLQDSIVSRRLATDEAGVVSGKLVAGDGYTLAWVPESPSELPFLVETGVSLREGADLSRELDYGAPVYGRVTHESAIPLAGVTVQAIDPLTGIGGPLATTSEDGRYMLRVLPGEYQLEFKSPELRILPTQTLLVTVEDESGVRQDLDYGSLRTVPIRGAVLTPDGDPAEDVRIRLRALSLEGMDSGDLVVELDTPTNGIFADDILPGTYEVEYIPPYFAEDGGADAGPILLEEPLVLDGSLTQIPTVTLPPRVSVNAQVVDSTGKAVAGALVRAREDAFGEYVYETVADDSGHFEIAVSDVPLTWSIQPALSSQGAITFFTATPDEIGETVPIDTGRAVTGAVIWRDEAVPFAVVEIRDNLGRLYGSTLTDENGQFSMRVNLSEPR